MELLPGIVADSGALFLPASKTLVLADLHLGYEAERRGKGVLLPSRQRELVQAELERLLRQYRPARVVVAGDLKHEFGRISQEEWAEVGRLLRWLQDHAAVEVIVGNHDKLLLPILVRLGIEPRRFLVVDEVLVVHGDVDIEGVLENGLERELLRTITTIIMGHEHPALAITDGIRTETVKCYLVGKQSFARKKRSLIVLPSFNPLVAGTDALRERPLGPLLASFGGFSAFAVLEGKVLAFGSVEMLQRRERQFNR